MGKLLNGEEIWMKRLEEVKKYIDENGKRPSSKNKNYNIKCLGRWLVNQHMNYKLKERCMKNKEIYDKWTEFINNKKYKKYFEKEDD